MPAIHRLASLPSFSSSSSSRAPLATSSRLAPLATVLGLALVSAACITEDELDDSSEQSGEIALGDRAGSIPAATIDDVPPAAVNEPGPVVAPIGAMRIEGGPIDFGDVTCDGVDHTRTLTLVNPNDVAGSFTAQMWDHDFDDLNFEVFPMQGTVPAHGSVLVNVRRRDAWGSASAREWSSAVRVTTAVAGVESIVDVDVHEVLRTAELVVTADTDLGWVPANTTVSVPVTITNRGNEPAPLAFTADAPLVAELPRWIAAGASLTGWVSYKPAASTFEGSLSVRALGSCQRPVDVGFSAGHGAFTVLHALDLVTIPDAPVTSAKLRVSNPGDEPLEIRCRADGPSPLAVVFSSTPITVPAGSGGVLELTMAPGDGSLGTTTADILCFAREGVAAELVIHSHTISRTVIPAGDSLPL